MTQQRGKLLCWHSERAGFGVLEQAVRALRTQGIFLDRVLYLVQTDRERGISSRVDNVEVQTVCVAIDNPTLHKAIYERVRTRVLPKLRNMSGDLHINVSPGTPAMHSVWLILYAGGAFPERTKLWSSQFVPETKQTRIDPVEFTLSTYLAEIRREARLAPNEAVYEIEAHSQRRRDAFESIKRYAGVPGAPLLVLGERGTGKTRLVETLVKCVKKRDNVAVAACGSFESSVVDSQLFGHCKGAFTGAVAAREGLLAKAHKGIFFLDEIQDLPPPAQRKLVRVLQDPKHLYCPVGSDGEKSSDFELVCASNLPIDALRKRLDADLFDRVSHLIVTIPSLRECREDLKDDWCRVWREVRRSEEFPDEAPWCSEIERVLQSHPLPGNLRDLQRLAALVMAWWSDADVDRGILSAVQEWERVSVVPREGDGSFGAGTYQDRVRWFKQKLARWAKERYGTWKSAAKALQCDEKTLRANAPDGDVGKSE